MQVHEFKELLERLSKPSSAFTQSESRDAETVAASFFQLGQEQLNRMVRHARLYDQPLLRVFQSDGWGRKLAHVHSFKIGEKNVRRHGFAQTEYLVEVTFMKTIDDEDNIDMEFPIPHFTRIGDKSGWTIFQSACRRAAVLGGGDTGLEGVVLNVYLQDGLHAAGFIRRQLARHYLYHHMFSAAPGGDDERRRKDNCDWTCGWRCMLHGCHSGCKWSVIEYHSKEIVNHAHIIVASCINSSSEIMKVVRSFVLTHTRFIPTTVDALIVVECWALFGLEGDTLKEAVLLNCVYCPIREALCL